MDRRKKFPICFPALIILIALCLPPGLTGGLDGTFDFSKSFGFTVGICSAAEGDEAKVVTITGVLFSRIERVGTKSEGPEYYLRMDDGVEIHILKKANLWQEDPALQEHIDKRVSVSGDLIGKEMFYKEVKPVDE